MRFLNTIKYKSKHSLIALLLASTMMLSCTGASIVSAGISGTGIQVAGISGTGIIVGVITGFGSIFVNGVEFEIDQSDFDIDGETVASQANLEIGMVVKLNGSINSDGVTGTVSLVTFDDDIEGPVSDVPSFVVGSNDTQKVFTILGYSITIDELSTAFKDTSFSSLTQYDMIEVSGYLTSSNTISATYIKKKGDFTADQSEIELKGIISQYDDPVINQFKLSDVVVEFNSGTDTHDLVFSDGMYVEVKGTMSITGVISADEIELKELGYSEEDGGIELQGIITDYVDISNFKINGQVINASQAVLEPSSAASSLADGVKVEVEGTIKNNILEVTELELKNSEIEVNTFVSSVDTSNNSILLSFPSLSQSIPMYLDNESQLDDETEIIIEPNVLALDDLRVGDFVKIEASLLNLQYVVSQLKRTESDDIKLQGRVDSYRTDVSIELLGITYSVDVNTTYEDESESNLTPTEFFSALENGVLVEIKDSDEDGILDEVSFE